MPAQSLLTSLAARYGIRYRDASLPDAHRLVAFDGAALNCLDWRGRGEPIVFLHGGALTAHSWDLVCLGLREEWRCIALDMRGHGDSDWAAEYRIESAVEDVEATVTHHAFERIHLVGNSLGGAVAAHYVAAYPNRVASLTLVDIGPGADFSATQPIREYMDQIDGCANLEEAVELGMRSNPRIDRDALIYRLLHAMRQREDRRVYWKQDRQRMTDYEYFMGKIAEIEQFASRVSAPVLVLRGARSRVFSDAAACECAALFERGRWVCIENAGHNIQESNPAGLVAALRGLLYRQR